MEGSEGFLPRWAGAWLAFQDGSGTELGTFRVVALDEIGRALLEGAAGLPGPASFRGEYRFDDVTVGSGASLEATDPVTSGSVILDGDIEVDPEVVADTLLVRAGSVIRPRPGQPLRFLVSGEMTVESGARIDVSGNGYAAGGAPSWVSPPEGSNAAGSHGSAGTYSGIAGEERVYDSVYVPQLPGGGGAAAGSGQPGGGVLELDVGTLMLDGEILARGLSNDGNDRPAGAGGAVLVRAASVTGSGRVDASGGDGTENCQGYWSGAGGGGRVALDVGSLAGFDPATQVLVHGGALLNCGDDPVGYAAPGTLLVKHGGSVHGDLIVDNGTEADGTPRTQGRLTHLPALGEGPVVSFETDGGDAWITASAPFRARWDGAWAVLLDGSGAELGSFQVTETDEAGRARLGDAAAEVGASTYRGEYRFDSVRVANSGLQASDPVRTPQMELAGETEMVGDVVAEAVVVQAGSVIRPEAGDTLRFEVTGQMTVEAGARLDVSGLGFAGGTAPVLVSASGSDAGGSHGGLGRSGQPGEVYDSVYQPSLPGGGGAGTSGGPGGGVVDLEVGELVIDGDIRARGVGNEAGTNEDSAGAGGTVRIRAGTLRGSGTIDVSGDGQNRCSIAFGRGSGGGGRIALDVGILDG
ncbi:MAG TPA: hypothetical protein VLF66_11205, partial [Thermoanaerobaculia bacterium]|nr:hypothetical protein [Thermoanaerobaculia bacterium]